MSTWLTLNEYLDASGVSRRNFFYKRASIQSKKINGILKFSADSLTDEQRAKLEESRKQSETAMSASASFNDAYLIRQVIHDAMAQSGKSRAQLADEMSYLLGSVVTERRLNGFAAESREDLLFPAQYARAMAEVTGDNRILTCLVEKAGFRVITDAEGLVLDLGRQVLEKERAEVEIASLKQQLQEGTR